MGIFSRITEIINANINAMLDKAEDPEKMVKLMIHEMEDTLTEVKSAAAEVVADKIRIGRAVKVETERQLDWEGKAKLAVEKGREDLAREAIEQKLACEKKLRHLNERMAEVEGHVKQYQSDITRLEEKLTNAKNRQRSLINKHHSAMNRKRVEEKIYRVNTSGAFARFDNFENRIDRWQAEAEVVQHSNTSLDQKFEDLAHGKDVEDELTKLKASLGSLGSAGKATAKSKAKKEEPAEVAS